MGLAGTSSVLVICTAEELLISLQALGSAKMQLRTTIRAIHQTGEHTSPSGFRIPALTLAKLLHPQPSVLINNRLLRVRDDLPFILRLVDGFVHLIADAGCHEVHRASRILAVLQNMNHCSGVPMVWVVRYFVAFFLPTD